MKVISNTILFIYSLRGALSKLRPDVTRDRLQNSPYFCVFKYARAVKQKVEAENKERDWACEARAVRARKILTPRFTDFFTDFEKKPTVLQSTNCVSRFILFTFLAIHIFFFPHFSIHVLNPIRSIDKTDNNS